MVFTIVQKNEMLTFYCHILYVHKADKGRNMYAAKTFIPEILCVTMVQ